MEPTSLSRRVMPSFRHLVAASLLVGASLPASAQKSSIDSVVLSSYKWRNIGPDRGGRSIAVSGVKGRPREAYFVLCDQRCLRCNGPQVLCGSSTTWDLLFD